MVGVEQGQVVPIHVGKLCLHLVCCLLRLLWSEEYGGDRDHGHDAEHLVGAVELRRGQDHLGQLGVQGQLRHSVAQVREVAIVVQCPQIVEQLQGPHQRLGRRGVHEVEVDQVLHTELEQGEHHVAHLGAQDLGVGLLLQLLVEGLLRVQPEALAWPGTSRTPGSLVGTGLGDGRHQQGLHADTGVVHLLLAEPWIHHVDHPVDGEGSLGNVGGHHHLAPGGTTWEAGTRGTLEDELLLFWGQTGVQGENHHLALVLIAVAGLVPQFAAGVFNLLFAGEEQQYVPRLLTFVNLYDGAYGSLHVVPLGLGHVEDLDGVHAPGHLEQGGAVEVLLELERVQGGAHHHHLQVRPLVQQLLDEPHEHVGAEGPLVGLVQHYHLVLLQEGVRHGLP
mmetsp:Transcript_2137/g.3137  ORF Transcript_2137/g.3137 Transcript_2137/m.3137 type:complete len:391 (-) Transcript_2137:559-1731(-)